MKISKEQKKEYRKLFGDLLKNTISQLDLNVEDFCSERSWSTSTVRYWCIGRSLPSHDALNSLQEYIEEQNIKGSVVKPYKKYIFDLLDQNGLSDRFESINEGIKSAAELAERALDTFYGLAKGVITSTGKQQYPPCGKTKAVIFDFDGTLTVEQFNKTTWEQLWISLKYDISECQKLHRQFDEGKISHAKWCALTEEKFTERHLHRDTLLAIAKQIRLIDGLEETFEYLQSRDIKIFIVSGSIMLIIKTVLKDYLGYIEEIKANRFDFDPDGYLTRIVGTQFDFEGKAKYIERIAEELEISPKDILFVGNSLNDRFAYYSGAKTLCINPHLTDMTDKVVWHAGIQTCRNLTEIKQYLD